MPTSRGSSSTPRPVRARALAAGERAARPPGLERRAPRTGERVGVRHTQVARDGAHPPGDAAASIHRRSTAGRGRRRRAAARRSTVAPRRLAGAERRRVPAGRSEVGEREPALLVARISQVRSLTRLPLIGLLPAAAATRCASSRCAAGPAYQVQRQEVEQWAEADVEEPGTGFILPALAMPAGGAFHQELRLRADVPPGRYRVIKHAAMEDAGGVILNFEFAVVATKRAV